MVWEYSMIAADIVILLLIIFMANRFLWSIAGRRIEIHIKRRKPEKRVQRFD